MRALLIGAIAVILIGAAGNAEDAREYGCRPKPSISPKRKARVRGHPV
jgi:hypothetical protein